MMPMTESELFIAHMGSIHKQIKALQARLKDDQSLLPDIHALMAMTAEALQVEFAIREFDRLLTVAHAGWLLRNYPDLVRSPALVAKDWIEAEARVQAYMAQHGPPDEGVKGAIDRTP